MTVHLSANSGWIELYLTEYTGVDQTNPIDALAGASGSASSVSSSNAPTTVAGDVIYGYCVGDWACMVDPGFAARSTFDSNLIEDKLAGNAGTYAATASATNGWTMHMLRSNHGRIRGFRYAQMCLGNCLGVRKRISLPPSS